MEDNKKDLKDLKDRLDTLERELRLLCSNDDPKPMMKVKHYLSVHTAQRVLVRLMQIPLLRLIV